MEDRYTFNKLLQRLEPKSQLCQYCFKAVADNMDDHYFAPIYNEQVRTNAVVFRSVKYNQVSVGIPRCKKCLAIHKQSIVIARIIGVIFAIASIFLIAQIFDNITYKIFFGIFASVPTAFIVSHLATNLITRKKGIFTKREGAKREPVVMGMLREGWTLNKPNA